MGGRVARCLVWLVFFPLTACGRDDTREQPVLLISARQFPIDTVTPVLRAKQKALFVLLTTTDRSALHDYVEAGYSWRYLSTDTARMSEAEKHLVCILCPTSIRMYMRPQATFAQLQAGFKPSALDSLPTEFSVKIEGKTARVTATGKSSLFVIDTYWHLKPEGWRAAATFQQFTRAEVQARANLARLQSRS